MDAATAVKCPDVQFLVCFRRDENSIGEGCAKLDKYKPHSAPKFCVISVSERVISKVEISVKGKYVCSVLRRSLV